jgi:probable rRNA maturation factor
LDLVVEISVEAGDWPDEAELQRLADEALAAAAAVLRPAPPLSPGTGEGDHAQHGGGGNPEPQRVPSPPPPASPVPLPRFAGEEPAEVSILFTDDAAIRRLNAQYRGQDKATNVLSFPQAAGPHGQAGGARLLGDIILAFETVGAEAALAGKPLKAHMAHLVIHGFLHLLGFDHEGDAEAETMEALERAALERMGIADPYADAQAT